MSDSSPDHGDPAQPPDKAERAHESGYGHLLHWLLVAASVISLREQARTMARNLMMRSALLAIAALLWLVAAGFLVAILIVWLATLVGVMAALAIVAAGLALIAIVLHVIAARLARKRRGWSWQTPFTELNQALHAGNVDEAAIGALMLAAISGLILGFRSGKH